MPTHVALLRGVNVGRANRIAMADLRSAVRDLGHAEVATYLQSGNVVFTTTDDLAPSALATELSAAIEKGLAVSCRVIVLTASQWRSVVSANPYPAQAAAEPTTVHAAAQQDDLTPADQQTLDQLLAEARAGGSPDQLKVVGRTTYLFRPGGLGRSKLAERQDLSSQTGSVWRVPLVSPAARHCAAPAATGRSRCRRHAPRSEPARRR